MPFVTITDPVEAHRYRQAGVLWFYSSLGERWIALKSEVTLDWQTHNMRILPGIKYAILVESEE